MNMKSSYALVLALGLFAGTAQAVPWDKPTDAEVAALPPYCMAKFRDVNVEYWQSALGSIYLHVHHYCGALVYISRYYKSNKPQDRRFFLQEIDNNLNYMIAHAEHSSTLMPEIYFTKGKFLALGGNDAEAAKEFLHAIELKPDYPDPYAAMADFYARVGNKKDALKVLEDGLRNAPKSRNLVRRYEELGGKLPLPDANPPVTAPAQAATPPTPPAAETKEQTAPITQQTVPATEPTQATDAAPEKIGSPTNPWCRFCTDDEPTSAGK